MFPLTVNVLQCWKCLKCTAEFKCIPFLAPEPILMKADGSVLNLDLFTAQGISIIAYYVHSKLNERRMRIISITDLSPSLLPLYHSFLTNPYFLVYICRALIVLLLFLSSSCYRADVFFSLGEEGFNCVKPFANIVLHER